MYVKQTRRYVRTNNIITKSLIVFSHNITQSLKELYIPHYLRFNNIPPRQFQKAVSASIKTPKLHY